MFFVFYISYLPLYAGYLTGAQDDYISREDAIPNELPIFDVIGMAAVVAASAHLSIPKQAQINPDSSCCFTLKLPSPAPVTRLAPSHLAQALLQALLRN